MCCLNCMGYLFNSEVFFGGGEISVDLSQKGGATQKRLGTTAMGGGGSTGRPIMYCSLP